MEVKVTTIPHNYDPICITNTWAIWQLRSKVLSVLVLGFCSKLWILPFFNTDEEVLWWFQVPAACLMCLLLLPLVLDFPRKWRLHLIKRNESVSAGMVQPHHTNDTVERTRIFYDAEPVFDLSYPNKTRYWEPNIVHYIGYSETPKQHLNISQ